MRSVCRTPGNVRWWLMVFSFVWAGGCGSIPPDRPELGLVSGIVMLDGKPLAGVTVTFNPQHGRSSMAVTDEQGRYELSYLWNVKGAKVGRHTVSIATSEDDDSGPRSAVARERIPEHYNTKSTLIAEVQPGENTINIEPVSN